MEREVSLKLFEGHEVSSRHSWAPIFLRALANQCIVSVAIGTFGEKPPPGLGLRHTYALLDYDRDKDAFLLWNPWGNTHRPKGPEGSANGYRVDHGRFFMPVADFVTYVKGMITIETNVPIQRKGSM